MEKQRKGRVITNVGLILTFVGLLLLFLSFYFVFVEDYNICLCSGGPFILGLVGSALMIGDSVVHLVRKKRE